MTSSADLGLAALQDWLQLVVTAPGGLAAGLRAARLRHGDAAPIREPPRGSAGDRLAIHARGYVRRLLSCLESDYPAVRALLGPALFERFAVAYLAARPPARGSLFELGAAFAEYLQRTRPPDDAVPAERRSFLDLPIDLARVERARLETMRARGPATEVEVSPLELLAGDAELRAAPCLRLVSLSHDVRAFVAAVDHQHGAPAGPLPPVPARPVLLAVSRVAFRPLLTELSPWQYQALSRCAERRSIAGLAGEVAAAGGEGRGAVLAELALWLPVARSLGMIDG